MGYCDSDIGDTRPRRWKNVFSLFTPVFAPTAKPAEESQPGESPKIVVTALSLFLGARSESSIGVDRPECHLE